MPILGERYIQGLTYVQPHDVIRKEIIQRLCIEPMSNSALNKCLAEDANHETGLEWVIPQVKDIISTPGQNFMKFLIMY